MQWRRFPPQDLQTCILDDTDLNMNATWFSQSGQVMRELSLSVIMLPLEFPPIDDGALKCTVPHLSQLTALVGVLDEL